ncbi:MAG: NAD(P)/FAD-dependent oxidoreductase, partial [Anaerolineae bacterium]
MKLIVIGAGVGGLTAAALLAKRGFDVTVLEAHVEPGGCAATFFHKGYRFDVGATLVGGFQPGGPHALVAEKLGISWPVRSVEPAMKVHLGDETIVRYGEDEAWRAERLRAFGPQTERFWRQQEFAADSVWDFAARVPSWPIDSLSTAFNLATKVRPNLVPIGPLALTNVRRWARLAGARGALFDTFLDAQLLIAAQAIASEANALYGAVALDLYRRGVAHVEGGVGHIAETLAQAVKAQGGRVLYRQAVTAIRHGKTYCIETTRGEFEADVVIANLTPWALAKLMGDDAPKTLATRVSNLKPIWSAFTVYLGVEEAAITDRVEHHQIVVNPMRPLGEGNSAFVSISPDWDTVRAPHGQRAITISTHTRAADWYALAHDEAAFEERKQQYAEKLIDTAARALPNLKSHLKLILPGTPLTFERFTRRVDGMVGGFPQRNLFTAWSPRIDRGLWLVGDSIFPGQSTAAVSLGALRVADELSRQGRES